MPPYRPSADLLLTTLAPAHGSRMITVVLSGRGKHAATGATAVHRFGGTVIIAENRLVPNPRLPLERLYDSHVAHDDPRH